MLALVKICALKQTTRCNGESLLSKAEAMKHVPGISKEYLKLTLHRNYGWLNGKGKITVGRLFLADLFIFQLI